MIESWNNIQKKKNFTSSDPHRDIILLHICQISDILCAKIWRGQEGEDNSDEI